jgi:hypothetical protein
MSFFSTIRQTEPVDEDNVLNVEVEKINTPDTTED